MFLELILKERFDRFVSIGGSSSPLYIDSVVLLPISRRVDNGHSILTPLEMLSRPDLGGNTKVFIDWIHISLFTEDSGGVCVS